MQQDEHFVLRTRCRTEDRIAFVFRKFYCFEKFPDAFSAFDRIPESASLLRIFPVRFGGRIPADPGNRAAAFSALPFGSDLPMASFQTDTEDSGTDSDGILLPSGSHCKRWHWHRLPSAYWKTASFYGR